MEEYLLLTEWGKGFVVGTILATCVTAIINMGIILVLDHLKERRRNS